MNGFRKLGAALGVAVALSAMSSAAMAEKLRVVASFSIIGDFAARIGGERIELRTLVGPDGDAHMYEPRPSDAIAAAHADVILINGLQLEGFMTRLIAASGASAPVVEVTAGIDVLRDPAGGHYHYVGGKAVFHAAPFDPHAWQSVANARVYVGNIAQALCAADTAGCDIYRANARAYLGELDALEGDIHKAIAAIPAEKRIVVVAHNAFRYFERAYGVRFLSPQGVSTEAEASAADVAGIVREIREKRVAAVLAENISDARLVKRIAAEAGMRVGGVLYSDALSGPEGPARSYLAMMRHNVDTIRAAAAPDASRRVTEHPVSTGINMQ
ncbi:MAG: zinc ABC transporter substrate-binding protein AztC [Pseudochelatococcus sp.]|uniref:zinc ABC transporter substrate-binding protein AztC n=1 Tax=Pseudochelatococcus sp. TaxID=2020869 RepID=UPI003D931022